MSPEEFGKALHKESTAKLNTRQDKNEYSRLTWGGN